MPCTQEPAHKNLIDKFGQFHMVSASSSMMFGIDLNMSPQQDDASEPEDQQEEPVNEESVNNGAAGTTTAPSTVNRI